MGMFKPPKELQLTFEKQLFEYIYLILYWNKCWFADFILLNTCNFHRKFRFIFSLILSMNAPNVHFREAKFQNFPGEHAPGTPLLHAPSVLDHIYITCRTNSELLPPGLSTPVQNNLTSQQNSWNSQMCYSLLVSLTNRRISYNAKGLF